MIYSNCKQNFRKFFAPRSPQKDLYYDQDAADKDKKVEEDAKKALMKRTGMYNANYVACFFLFMNSCHSDESALLLQ